MTKIIKIDINNMDSEHICCAISNQKQSNSKKMWMKDRFSDGLVFKKINVRGKVFIEYMPAEKAWKPIVSPNYLLINCLWVSGQHQNKGYAGQLLQEAIMDAKKQNKDGLIYVSGNKKIPFLTHKSFFEKHGFQSVDKAPPYFELMTLKFDKSTKDPCFNISTKSGEITDKESLVLLYSNQCPFMVDYLDIMASAAVELDIPVKIIRIKTCKEAQEFGNPFGTFAAYYKGKFHSHILRSKKQFIRE